MLLEDVGFYEKRGVSFRSLLDGEVVGRRRAAGRDARPGRHRRGARGRARRHTAANSGRRRGRSAHESFRGVTTLRRWTLPPPAATAPTRRFGRATTGCSSAKFCAVGAVGYLVNLAVYAALLHGGLHYLLAATCSFLVAVTSNYIWNRLWTFRDRRAGVAAQGMRFFIVSLASLGANLLVLHVLITLGAGKLVGQAIAIVLVTPLNFVGNRLWSFRHPRSI